MQKLTRTPTPADQQQSLNGLCTVLKRPQLFSVEECLAIREMADALPELDGTIGAHDDKTRNERVRKSAIKFCQPDQNNAWVFDRIEREIYKINEVYRFDLEGFFEGYQVARYEPGGHYTWHMDIGNGGLSLRKLSLTVQLSDPEDYEGGELRHIVSADPASREQGSMTVFPSYLLHTVEPVTRGVRYSLVAWVSGKPFR